MLATARGGDAAIPAHLRAYETVVVEGLPVEGGATLHLRLRAFGRTLDVELEPSPLLAANAETITVSGRRVRREASRPALFRGRVAGDPASSVRLASAGRSWIGSIETGGDTWYLEPLRRHEPGAAGDRTLVYRASDVDAEELGPVACASAATSSALPTSTLSASSVTSTSSETTTTARLRSSPAAPGLLELTIVADSAFAARHGADSAAAMQVVVDRVASFFETNVGLVVSVVRTVVYETAQDDPLTTSTDSYELLASVNLLRSSHPDTLGSGDALHLFTGRELDRKVAGVAYIGSVCDSSAISLSQDFSSDLHVLTLLVGHELGHTIGAWHDGDTGPCAATPTGYVMWPTLESYTAEAFSRCSMDSIGPVLDAATCISDAIPAGCGNGVLDDGEECDDGNNEGSDCCRVDCRYDVAGNLCTADGNPCTADVCDGAGTCLHPDIAATCDDADACTTYGQCTDGACVASKNWKPLASPRLKARFGDEAGTDVVQVRAALAASLQSPPTVAGVTLRFLDESGGVLREIFAPASQWSDRKGTGRSFSFESGETANLLAATGGVQAMKLRYASSSATAKLRIGLKAVDFGFLEGRRGVGLQVLVGDAVTGDCGTVLSMACDGTVARLSCD